MRICSALLMSLVVPVGRLHEENQVLHDNRAQHLESNLVLSEHYHIHDLILASEQCCECVITTLFFPEENTQV